MTGENPEVRSDKRKPREDRQNYRYHRYDGSHYTIRAPVGAKNATKHNQKSKLI